MAHTISDNFSFQVTTLRVHVSTQSAFVCLLPVNGDLYHLRLWHLFLFYINVFIRRLVARSRWTEEHTTFCWTQRPSTQPASLQLCTSSIASNRPAIKNRETNSYLSFHFSTILSYIATAVTSADTAIQYLNYLLQVHANTEVSPLWATIGTMHSDTFQLVIPCSNNTMARFV